MLKRDGKQPGINEISPLREKGLWWEGYAQLVGFVPGVKELGSYG